MANKDKNNQMWLAGGMLLLLAGIVSAIKGKRNQDPSTQQNQTATAPPTTHTQPTPKPLDTNMVLKKGSRGEEVKALQRLIGATADGVFGPGTETALRTKTGLLSASISQVQKIIQDKLQQASTEQRKTEIIWKYKSNMKVIAAVDVLAPFYQNRNGLWLSTSPSGSSLGHAQIKKGQDLGIIVGWYDYNTPWIIIEPDVTRFGSTGKKLIMKGSWLLI